MTPRNASPPSRPAAAAGRHGHAAGFDTALLVAFDAENRAGLAEQVHPSKPFRDAAQVCEQEVSRVLTDISLDKEMYNVLASLDGARLDPAGTYYLKTTLRDYHRAGVDRDDATRDKIRNLQDELVKIGQQFDENIAADVRKLQVNASDLDGLPEDFKRSHPADASGKVTLSTDNTDYFPFMDYAKSEPARKAFFVLYRQRAYPKNIDVLGQLLQKRHELANVLGYPDWAAYITEDKMVGTEQNASDFIEKISVAAQPGAKRDYEELLAYKKKEDPEGGERQRLGRRSSEARSEDRKIRIRLPGHAALFRIFPGAAGNSRHHQPDVRHHLQTRDFTRKSGIPK